MIWAALVSSLVAVGVHAYLFIHHLNLKLGLTDGPSSCNVSETFNCDSVSMSSFSTFLGLPLALWGLWTNLMLAFILVLVMIGLLEDRQRTTRYAGYFSIFIALVSVVMAGISSVSLGTYCLYCMAAYVLSFLTVFFIAKTEPLFRLENFKADIGPLFSSQRWVLGCLIAIPVGAFVSDQVILKSYRVDGIKARTSAAVESWKLEKDREFNLQNGLQYQKDSSQAPVMTIVEFADFLCPHCRSAYPTVHAFVESRPDVKLVFKSFPLDGVCNKDITHKGDGRRCTLATAVYCGEKTLKKGWDVHHYLFDNQMELASESALEARLEGFLKSKGWAPEDFMTCLKSDEAMSAIEAQAKEGFVAQIQGTPAFFVNGKQVQGGALLLSTLESVYKSLKGSTF